MRGELLLSTLWATSGTMPRTGTPRYDRISSGDFRRASRYSSRKTRPEAEQPGGERRDEQVAEAARPGRGVRRDGFLNDPDVRRLGGGGQPRLLGLLQQRVQHLAVCGCLALQAAVLNRNPAQAERLALLSLEGVGQALLLGLRREEVVPHRVDDLRDLALQPRFGGLQRGPDPDHVGMPLAVLVGELGLLPLQIGNLPLELLDVAVRQDQRERVDGSPIVLQRRQLVVELLLLDPVGLGLRRRRHSGPPGAARRCSAGRRGGRIDAAPGTAAPRLHWRRRQRAARSAACRATPMRPGPPRTSIPGPARRTGVRPCWRSTRPTAGRATR